MDTRQLAAWCLEAARSIKKMFRCRNVGIIVSEKASDEIVAAFIGVAETAMKSALRFWALDCVIAPGSGTGSGSAKGVSHSLETVRLAGAMVMEASEVICSTVEGCELIKWCVNVLVTVGCESEAERGLKGLIKSPYCIAGSRGEWCARLVRFAVALAVEEQGSASRGNGSDDDDDEEDVPVVAVSKHQCEDIYLFIENIFHTHPELLVGAQISCFYETVISLEMDAVAASTTKEGKGYAFVSTVAKRAIENCPHVHSFWDVCEKILRLQGSHKEANHIRWRRDRESKP